MDAEHEGGSPVAASSSSLEEAKDSKLREPGVLVLPAARSTSSPGLGEELASPGSLENLTLSPVASHAVSSELESLRDAGRTVSAGSSARRYDVYIGVYAGADPLLVRYVRWMHAELEMSLGVACFAADRSVYSNSDPRSHDIARSVLHSATYGVVVLSRKSFRNVFAIEELAVFASRGNLVPVFFDVLPGECRVRDIVDKQGGVWEVHGGELWKAYRGEEKGWVEAVEGLERAVEGERVVEAHRMNWRDSIREVVGLVGESKDRVGSGIQGVDLESELPWPRNEMFLGREMELKAMEKILFADVGNNATSGTVAQTLARGSDASSSNTEREEPELGRLSNYDSENHDEITEKSEPNQPAREIEDVGRRRSFRASTSVLSDRRRAVIRGSGRSFHEHKRRDSADRRGESDRTPFAPACVVTGVSGIGKSELALEFAYRHSQKYRFVLWVGGEGRYLRQNYLNLSTALSVDVTAENPTHSGALPAARARTFDEQEESAVLKVRRELEKDIPYLLVIDNLDATRDPWDGRELGEILPRIGSAAHILITTRLPRVMVLKSLEVPFLSSFESLSLMRDLKRHSRSFSVQQVDKFKDLETKLGRLPFGLRIVGGLINEFKLKPSELLAKMGTAETLTASEIRVTKAHAIFASKPYILKLLDVCFDLMCGGAGFKKSLAMRMAYAGGWFAPAPCPLSLLALAAQKLRKESGGLKLHTRFVSSLRSCWLPNRDAVSEADASALLIRLGLARASTREDCIYFPDVIQAYCRVRGGVPAARSAVRAIRRSGSVAQHYDHLWAAAFVVCRGFGSDVVTPAVVEFQVPDLLLFTQRLVMPLAARAFNAFSRCTAAAELLRLCFVMLEEVEKSYVAQIENSNRWDQTLCWRRASSTPRPPQVDEYVWQDLTLLKAAVLEARARLLLRGGQYDAGEELCRTSINIRTVMQGAEHPDTVAVQDTLSRFRTARGR